MQRVLIVGDIHGSWVDLRQLIEEQHPDLVLQCGDFGWRPMVYSGGAGLSNDSPMGECDVPIHWCDGNHDQHDILGQFSLTTSSPQAHELTPGVFYQQRGSTLELEDGRTVLFAGGALSADWEIRDEGIDWWREELLTEKDLERFPNSVQVKIDIVISHTAPTAFHWSLPTEGEGHDEPKWILKKFADPSCAVLQRIFDRHRPRQWFFGHFHRHHQGEHAGCKWTGLACPEWQMGRGMWWTWL